MKVLKKVLWAILTLVIVLAVAVACIWGKEIGTLSTMKQLDDDGFLYEMEYKASYDLDDVLASDIDENARLMEYVIARISRGLYKPHVEKAGHDFGCTCFQAKNAEGEGYLFGRNYDFMKDPTLVLHSHPGKGYSSISFCDMSHLGYSLDKLPDSFVHKALSLAAIYAPMDGMNEKGLCVSIMTIPDQPSQQRTGKHAVGTTILMRLILDRCATVQDALELVETIDVRHDTKAGAGYHYMIADAGGDCAVLEFDKNDEWKTMIVRKPDEAVYLHSTNHLLSPKYYTTEPDPSVGNPHSKSWWRYETVAAYLDEKGGVVTVEDAQECLSNVHWKDMMTPIGVVEDTQYSNVYDQNTLTVLCRPWNDYDTTYRFNL